MSRRKSILNAAQAAIALTILVAIAGLAAGRGLQAQSQTAATPQWPCNFNVPTVSPTIPNDATLSDQPTMNCFAWQEFIALNWAAASGQRGVADPSVTAAQFGAPNAMAPTVWETYKNQTEVFLARGAKPKPWNDPPPAPPCASGTNAALALLKKPGARVLFMTSAFGDFILDDTNQASGPWLADQNGNLVYYEIKLDKDEFDTIVQNGFYNGAVQNETASTGKNPTPGGQYQVKLPAGCNPGSCPNNGQARLGAIELKAAWRVLTDPTLYTRYLTSQAVLVNSAGACSNATMGLVGLHIIHKTVSQPQFVWATFEQVDNVPPASPATFSNSACQCQTAIPSSCFKTMETASPYQNCKAGQTQGQACTPNTPPYDKTSASCPAYPTQVARKRPISNNSSDPVAATNTAAQNLIAGSNAQSVFQYYQLVDVLWSGSPQDSYTNTPGNPGPNPPLSMSGATPDPNALPVANSTMETYVQQMTCLSCHVFANVPPSTDCYPNVPPSKNCYASDFSFIMGDAQSPAEARVAAALRPRRSLPEGLVKLQH
jgi:hypothetical protein